MPELPEVEVTRLGLEPLVVGQTIDKVQIHQKKLRWEIPQELAQRLPKQTILGIQRRAKYLLFETNNGHLLVHLGMSGHLRVVPQAEPKRKHDHFELLFQDGRAMRFNDTRRFGAVLYASPGQSHACLAALGVEPLTRDFSGQYLYNRSRNRSIPVKTLLMDGHIVVGIGNIYANETLFAARISPMRPACDLTLDECQNLVKAAKQILRASIKQGGTTLKDFYSVAGKPGYFRQVLQVYGRGGEPCPACESALESCKIASRATVFCETCQA